jgi:TRAP-type mannitol/chloroaromatic compound transport system permease small subunit
VNETIGKILSLMVYGLAFLVTFEVIARYVFNMPTTWGFETQIFIFGVVAILGGGYTLLQGGHISVTILVDRLSLRTRAIINVCTYVLFFFFIGVLLWDSSYFAWDSFRHLEHSWSVWSPPLYPIKLAIPIGVTLLLLQGIACFVRELLIAFKVKDEK